jgi:hypothetical protein
MELHGVSYIDNLSSYRTYQMRLLSTHTSPRVQPTVVSPRKLRQFSRRSVLTSFPATMAVKTIRTAAHA